MFRRTAALVASGAVALGGVALLVPHPASAADQVVAAVGDQAAGQGHGRLLDRAQRRELRQTGHLTVTRDTKKHGTVTVLVQVGDITAVSPTSVSLKSKDGFTHSYTLTDKTKIKQKGETVTLSGVKVGQKTLVVALHTKDGDNARRLALRQVATAG
jgi:hypothetical protein